MLPNSAVIRRLINMQLGRRNRTAFRGVWQSRHTESINAALDSLGVLNMLNLKYIIYNKQALPLVNPYNNGNAWFVDNIRVAADANEEMKLLGEIDTKRELVVDKALASDLPAAVTSDSTSTIVLKSYKPNHLIYSVDAKNDQVAVFSEIFYDKGWKATINGKEVPYTRVNYLLRGMPLKAGMYNLEFRFDPAFYKIGNTIALISSVLLLLSVVGYLYFVIKRRKKLLKSVKRKFMSKKNIKRKDIWSEMPAQQQLSAWHWYCS